MKRVALILTLLIFPTIAAAAPRVGDRLTGTPASWEPREGEYLYHWMRTNTEGQWRFQDWQGTDPAHKYVVAEADVGYQLLFYTTDASPPGVEPEWLKVSFNSRTETVLPRYRGVNSHAPWFWEVSEEGVKREITEAAALGVNHLRVPVEWGAIETAKESRPSSEALTRLDLIVNEAAAHGIKVDGTIDPTPSWASTGKAWNDAPSNPEVAKPFAKWLAERYGSKLAALGALNEPNVTGNYLEPNGHAFPSMAALAAYYTQEANAIYAGAHEASSSVKVLAGESGNGGGYLTDIIGDGVKMDGLGLHAYSEGGPPEAACPNSTKCKVEEAHGLTAKPIWVNEWGYSNEDTETVRAEYTQKGVEVLDGFSYVEGWAYYQLHDPEGSGHEESFGLLKHDFSRRPSFAAFTAGL
jgi:hypothetical protein